MYCIYVLLLCILLYILISLYIIISIIICICMYVCMCIYIYIYTYAGPGGSPLGAKDYTPDICHGTLYLFVCVYTIV